MTDYRSAEKLFKALSERIRLQILALLSGREMCACDLLENLAISQSTLSHHMKILMECKIVSGRKDTIWMFYSIQQGVVAKLHTYIDLIINEKKDTTGFSSHDKCNSKKVIKK